MCVIVNKCSMATENSYQVLSVYNLNIHIEVHWTYLPSQCSILLFRIQTFSIGMEGSPDIEHAQLVAKHLQTEHHEIIFTPEEGFQAVRDVIYSLECYDTLTIRGSVAMYLMSKYIRENTDTTILFSGIPNICTYYLYMYVIQFLLVRISTQLKLVVRNAYVTQYDCDYCVL